MNVEKCLKGVGKAVFIKYYYVFANMPYEDCMEMFTENYTEKSKKNRVTYAKAIFLHRKQYEALKIICNSPKIDTKTKNRALRIFAEERKKRRYCVLS